MVSWGILFYSVYFINFPMFPKVSWRSRTPGTLSKDKFPNPETNWWNPNVQRDVSWSQDNKQRWFLFSWKSGKSHRGKPTPDSKHMLVWFPIIPYIQIVCKVMMQLERLKTCSIGRHTQLSLPSHETSWSDRLWIKI